MHSDIADAMAQLTYYNSKLAAVICTDIHTLLWSKTSIDVYGLC